MAQQLEYLQEMHLAGVPILTGTDFGARLVYPGWSVHDELALLVEHGGLSSMEALQAATRNAASTLGLPGERGTLREGSVADLAVLDVPNHLFLGYQSGWNPVDVVVKNGAVAWSRRRGQ